MSKVLLDARSSAPQSHAAMGLLVVTIATLPILSGLGLIWIFTAVLAASYLLEAYVATKVPTFMDIMRRVQMGHNALTLIRQASTLMLAAVSVVLSPGWLVILAGGFISAHGVRALTNGLQTYVDARRTLPVTTRNVDLSALRIPDSPHPRWMPSQLRSLFEMDFPIAAGVIAAIVTGKPVIVLFGCGVTLTIQAIRAAVLLVHARKNRHLKNKNALLATVNREVAKAEPEVAVYFTGSTNSAYQINMWLRTIERLERSAVIIMREQQLLSRLGLTSIPVVCIPDNIHLMNFELPSIRTALYPGNAGKNIHMLRIPGVTHVFIGHGDSDKPASFNPFSKVYSQIWTAGRAGRDRYKIADIGVADSDIREVGRPQLHNVRHIAQRLQAEQLTVLYAPTWEGWTSDLAHSSLLGMGPTIVRKLLTKPGVRVLYRPHPLTGTRDRRALAAHRTIVALLDQANTRAALPPASQTPADLTVLSREIARLAKPDSVADEAQRARDAGIPDLNHSAEVRQLEERWSTRYWAAATAGQHHVVTGMPQPTLNDMFNQSDLLITDVSSVISDFIVSEKPYVVCNPAGHDHQAFRTVNPTSGAGYLLDPDCEALDMVLTQVERLREDEHHQDPLAEERHRLSRYLLGPATPNAMERFRDAVNAAVISASGPAAKVSP